MSDTSVPRHVGAFAHAAGSVATGVPGGATGWQGTLLNIHIAPAASYEREELAEAHGVAGRGIQGDRYFLGTGTYSPKPDTREVTLIEQRPDRFARLEEEFGPVVMRGDATERGREAVD